MTLCDNRYTLLYIEIGDVDDLDVDVDLDVDDLIDRLTHSINFIHITIITYWPAYIYDI